MTPSGEQLCYVDAYARSVEARVVAVETARRQRCWSSIAPCSTRAVAASRRIAAWSSGGLDGRSWTVRAARKVGGEIVHELEPDGGDPPAVGDARPGRPRLGATARPDADPHGAPCAVRRRVARLRRARDRRQHGAGRRPHGLRVRTYVRATSSTPSRRRVNAELAAARDVRVAVLPRDEAFAIPDLIRTKVNLLPEGIERDPHDRDRRARPPGRRRDPRRQHARGRRHPGHRLRVQGPHQQADPDQPRGPGQGLNGPRRP